MKILVAGDFVPSARIKQLTEKGDFHYFDEVKAITANVDYSIVNFESPIVVGEAQPITKTGPNLKCHPNAMLAVKYAGFDCVTLANNHFYDYGEKGVMDTLNTCRANTIDFVGGGGNLTEAESILYKKINGLKLAVINCCEHEWSIALTTHGGSNPLNPVRQYYSISEAKRQADYVIVIVHGGTEHYNLPSPRMKETYRFFIDAGADAVINHHQHCYSGYEIYNQKPIFYGLGNFCFDKGDNAPNFWKEGFMVMLDLNNEEVGIEIYPYEQCAKDPVLRLCLYSSTFDEVIMSLNKKIMNDEELKKEYNELSKRRYYVIRNLLEPYASRLAKALRRRYLLPSFMNRKKMATLLGHIQCESHRDLLIDCLSCNI